MKQLHALDALLLGHNVLLTGPAGSGKTHVLNSFITKLRERGVAVGVTASTGIAATHMQGITIHSWSGIGIKQTLSSKELETIKKRSYIRDRMQEAKVLVIDEISMLHAFQLDLVDEVCRTVRESDKPFGGLQVILSGDFFQLPPIGERTSARFAYHARVWSEMDMTVCYLEEQFRQTDDVLTRVLYDIRTNNVTDETLEPLRERYRKDIEGDIYPTKLYTHNADVDRINEKEIEQLDGEEYVYEMHGRGSKHLIDVLKKGCLAPEKLRLKEGAVVMFVKNNFDEGYVNGTLGTVERFDNEGMPVVRIASGKSIHVKSDVWVVEDEGSALAEIYQLPLRLAWAITVHKSQGMSLDAAEVDLSQSFEPGMGYVALSRVRTLKGLKLMGLNEVARQVSPEALRVDEELRQQSDHATSKLGKISLNEKKQKQASYIEAIAGIRKKSKKKLSTFEKTKILIKEKKTITDIAQSRGMTEGTIIGHLEKFVADGWEVDLNYLKPPQARFKKIEAAFKKTGDNKLGPVRSVLGNKYSFEEIRIARLFL